MRRSLLTGVLTAVAAASTFLICGGLVVGGTLSWRLLNLDEELTRGGCTTCYIEEEEDCPEYDEGCEFQECEDGKCPRDANYQEDVVYDDIDEVASDTPESMDGLSTFGENVLCCKKYYCVTQGIGELCFCEQGTFFQNCTDFTHQYPNGEWCALPE